LSDCKNKKQFLQCLEPEEAHKLLLDKADVSKKPLKYSTFHFLKEELITCASSHSPYLQEQASTFS
jgi:hypothetical protein